MKAIKTATGKGKNAGKNDDCLEMMIQNGRQVDEFSRLDDEVTLHKNHEFTMSVENALKTPK